MAFEQRHIRSEGENLGAIWRKNIPSRSDSCVQGSEARALEEQPMLLESSGKQKNLTG